MYPGFILLQVILTKQAQRPPWVISVIISVLIQNIKSAKYSPLVKILYAAFGNQAYDNNETGTRSNLVNVIKMMPYMPVYDPTTSDGFRGVNSVLDGGDPTNPIEDAKIKNPGNRRTAKILGTAYLEVNFTNG